MRVCVSGLVALSSFVFVFADAAAAAVATDALLFLLALDGVRRIGLFVIGKWSSTELRKFRSVFCLLFAASSTC